MQRLDRAPWLARLIENTSAGLARRRGLLPLVGVLLLVVAFVFQAAHLFAALPWLGLVGLLVQLVGLLLAIIGLLLVQPLGQ